MANHNTKLELTWIGKENWAKLEPRILLEDPEKKAGGTSSCWELGTEN